MMDWLAGVYINSLNIIHYMHDKYSYERLEMALHDTKLFAQWQLVSLDCLWQLTLYQRLNMHTS